MSRFLGTLKEILSGIGLLSTQAEANIILNIFNTTQCNIDLHNPTATMIDIHISLVMFNGLIDD